MRCACSRIVATCIMVSVVTIVRSPVLPHPSCAPSGRLKWNSSSNRSSAATEDSVSALPGQ
jgi:hypothetical protein